MSHPRPVQPTRSHPAPRPRPRRPRMLASSLAMSATLVGALASPASAAWTAPVSAGSDRHLTSSAVEGRSSAPAPSAAAASVSGTIVFVRNHNLWVVAADGSGLRPLTKDGTADRPYESPSISDTGVVAAMRGSTIVRIHQDGTVLGTLTPPDLFVPTRDTLWITPILHPAISPDGSRIAYSQMRAESYGGEIVAESLTAFTDAARLSDVSQYGIAVGDSPSWVTGSRVVLNRKGDVHLFDLGADEAPVWFRQDDIIPDEDPTNPFDFVGFRDTTVSRDRSRVLFGFGPLSFGSTATVGDPAVGSPAPANGQPECWVTSEVPQQEDENVVDSPTFGPDSDSVAYEEAGDLWVLTNLSACNHTTTMTKLVDDAQDPAWSAAALGAPAPGSGGGAGPGGGAGSQASAFALAAEPKIRGRAVPGRRLSASAGQWTPAPTAVSYVWLRNGKAIKGATSAKYRVKRADRGDRLAVRVTVHRDGYPAATSTSAAVRVKK